MRTALIGLAISLSLLAGTAIAAPAQQVMRRVEPKPMDATDPLAIRSAALVKHIIAGDKAAATALLRQEADEAYVKSGRLETDVDAQIKRLAGGNYTIGEFEQGFGADVLVQLSNVKGDETNIIVRYNGDKKVTGFAEAKIQR